MNNYEETFEEFWRSLVCNEDGTLNEDLVKRELHDYANMMREVSEVYDYVSRSMISKPNTLAFEVISAYEDRLQRDIDDALYEQLAGEDL